MGNLNKSWSSAWIGTSDVQCTGINLFSKKDELHTIYQVHQSGNRFVDQIVSESDSIFANIRTIKCGSGIIVKTIDKSAFIPNMVETGTNNGVVVLNFPLNIVVSGLTGDYENGNGEYIITTYFQNNSPTYKSKTGWIIQRNNDGYWYIIPPIGNMLKLKGSNQGPVDSPYIQQDCSSSNCPTANVYDKSNPITPTPTPQQETPTPEPLPTPTPISTSDISVEVQEVTDTSIELHYQILNPSVKMWETELSSDINFSSKKTITGPASTKFHTFDDLTHSSVYYIRTRVYTDSDKASNWINMTSNTTIPGASVGLSISLTSEKFPRINWITPNVEFEYKVEIIREPEFDEIVLLNGNNLSEYTDSSATQEIKYTYRISFVSNNFRGSSKLLKIKIDKTAPSPPILLPTEAATKNRNLIFKWNADNEVNYYLYKFNTSQWTKYKGTGVTIKAEEGQNTFRIMSIDFSENRSSEIVRSILVDLTKPNSPNITSPVEKSSLLPKQTFRWTISGNDITSLSYRINKGTWVSLDKSVSELSLDLPQGKNLFDIKAIDHVGNESDISSTEIQIDNVPPPKPTLKRVEDLADIDDSVTFDWSSSSLDDVEKWEYSYTQWNYGSPQPKSNWNNFLSANILTKSFSVIEGYSLFEIRAIDKLGNKSEVASNTFDVDSNPPLMPTLKEPEIRVREDKVAIGLYKWEISKDTHKVLFKLNDEEWIPKKRDLVQSHEFALKQGINEFRIYAEDAKGNKSSTNLLSTRVDTQPASAPVILGPHGQCPANLWKKLWESCQESKTGAEQSVRITYSFMPTDKLIGSFHTSGTSRDQSFLSKPVPSFTNMVKHIDDAFKSWSTTIRSAFPNVNVMFENIGYETTSIPSSRNVMFKQTDQGDIRIAFVSDFQNNSNFADRRYDDYSDLKTGISDIYIDTNVNWSQPNSATSSSVDIRLGLRYYIGKSLGLSENKNLKHGSAYLRTGAYDETVDNNADRDRFLKIYSLPFKTEDFNKQTITAPLRYVNENDLNISFKSDEQVSIQYKYDFISTDNLSRIVKAGDWISHLPNKIKSGQIDLRNAFLNEPPSNKIRFYLRSTDLNNNTSDITYCDYILLNKSNSIGVASVAEYCEQNPSLKINNSCWDIYGLYSCMVSLNRNLEDGENVTLRIKPESYDYYILSHNIDLVAHSLFPKTEYIVDGYVFPKIASINESTENNSYQFVSLNSVDGKQFVTKNSDKKPPQAVTILYIDNAQEKHPKQYTRPVGQLRQNGKYVPAMELSWSKCLEDDFYKYEILISESSSFPDNQTTKRLSIPNRDVIGQIIVLDKYNTTYYVKILTYDESKNISESGIKVYTTVVRDDEPNISTDFTIAPTSLNGYQSKYNEEPDSKWTLGFQFPRATDLQYPSIHKIQDVEDALRNDYTDSDWLSLLGHLPMRIESKQWPGQGSTQNYTGYWISRSNVRDDNNQIINNPPIILTKSGHFRFRHSKFEADTSYSVRMKIYDITGHYLEKAYSFKTPKIEGDVTAPPRPNLSIQPTAYYNGKDYSGEDFKKYQWVLRLEWTIKNTNDLSKFVYLEKTENEKEFTGGYYDINKLEKVTNGEYDTYKVLVTGFQPNTKYNFKFNSVDSSGNWSDTGTQNYITSIGDNQSPEDVNIENYLRAIHSKYGDVFAFSLLRPNETDLSLFIYLTKNLNETDFYKFESKWRVDYSSISFDKYILIPDLEDNVQYKVGFAWRDASYNWSNIKYLTLPKKPQVLDEYSIQSDNQNSIDSNFEIINKIE